MAKGQNRTNRDRGTKEYLGSDLGKQSSVSRSTGQRGLLVSSGFTVEGRWELEVSGVSSSPILDSNTFSSCLKLAEQTSKHSSVSQALWERQVTEVPSLKVVNAFLHV